MKKYLKIVFILFVSIFIFLTSCGKDEVRETGAVLSDGEKRGDSLEYVYEYGQQLDFIGKLKMYIEYSDNSLVELTEEEYKSVIVKMNDEEIELRSDMKFDVGMYGIQFYYKSYSCNVTITITNKKADVSNYSIKFFDANSLRQTTTFKFGNESIDDNKLTSDVLVSVYDKTTSKALTSQEVLGIFYLTPQEYNSYKLLASEKDKNDYLISKADDFENYRNILYNNDGIEENNIISKFYVQTANSFFLPGQYYFFARVDIKNIGMFITLPSDSDHVTVTKGLLHIKNNLTDFNNEYSSEELLSMLNLQASYNYNLYFVNHKIGKFKLSEVGSINLDIDNELSNRMLINFGGSYNSINIGHFEFANKNAEYDCNSNNGVVTVKAKFVLDSMNDYYEVDEQETYDVTLTITKGVVQRPYISKINNSTLTTVTYDFGENIIFAPTSAQEKGISILYVEDTDLISYTQLSTPVSSSVGSYFVQYYLIDSVNYEFDEFTMGEGYYDGGIDNTFNWVIEKRTVDNDVKIMYNDNVFINYFDNTQYLSSVNEWFIDISYLVDDIKLPDDFFSNRTFDIAIESQTGGFSVLKISNTNYKITYTGANINQGDNVYVNITADSNDSYNAYHKEVSLTF